MAALRMGAPRVILHGDSRISHRFWNRVQVDALTGCWPCTGYRTLDGYCTANSTTAHRFVYLRLVGPIPTGWQVDHICHDPSTCLGGPTCPHRSCVNPAHLKAVRPKENVRRSNGRAAVNGGLTRCRRGHRFTPENTRIEAGGRRRCIAYKNDYNHMRYARAKAAA